MNGNFYFDECIKYIFETRSWKMKSWGITNNLAPLFQVLKILLQIGTNLCKSQPSHAYSNKYLLSGWVEICTALEVCKNL